MKNKQVKGVTKPVSLITLSDSSSPISEQYRTIRTNIQFSITDRNLKTLVVTSSGPGEGKSTTSANLAVVFAKSGLKVLLVDADMRKPTVAKTFNLMNHTGLSTLLSEGGTILSSYTQRSLMDNLDVMTSGPKPPNPSEMLGSRRMQDAMNLMKEQYDLIIFDMPPVVAVTDAQIMSSVVDGTILVVREGVSNKKAAQKAAQLLDMANANVLGAIYNGASRSSDQGYYYYYGTEK
ncbi:CpsD/CapB family tyrosine-protein kinase [Vagococcus zengguangii]|uniref:CpsD/CapB family tyrosine-protein kinase n=1 Tax=Vagococcus zengguangii TaxID=2571750 RepID=UPI001108A6B5|nr:CpsD/CapB family tyrosine-protein kinase [Vagococcus zengguangii]TLG80937.1 CpsD/CapB family tyrosine-protein kinase [Vagococcus zengguangii]